MCHVENFKVFLLYCIVCILLFCLLQVSFIFHSGTAALEEDAQILKVIEAYCTSAKTRQTLNSSKCML